jgi:GNAT superfamily N-acetyltransferase
MPPYIVFDCESMEFIVIRLGAESLDKIPSGCGTCIYWEYPVEFDKHPERKYAAELKAKWIMEHEGSKFGGFIALRDDVPIGFCQFAGAPFFPNVITYSCGFPSYDSLFVACLYVLPGERGHGVGSEFIRKVEREAVSRGYRAVETFARRGSEDNPSGPVDFWLKAGYHVLPEGGGFMLMRKEGLAVKSSI